MKSKQLSSVPILLSALVTIIAVSSCGVRGRPLPPVNPPELGHGQPGFKRASEEFAFPNVATPGPSVSPTPREDAR